MYSKGQTTSYGQEWRDIPHKDCQTEYIGETGKKLRKRITENKNAVRRRDLLTICLIRAFQFSIS